MSRRDRSPEIREALLAQLHTPHAYLYHASASVAAALRVPLEDVEREWQPMLDAGMIVYHDGRYRTKGAA